jgi:hypothetical protein
MSLIHFVEEKKIEDINSIFAHTYTLILLQIRM